MAKQALNLGDGPGKYDLFVSLGAGDTNRRMSRRVPVIMHVGGLGPIHMFIEQLARGTTTAGAANDDVLHKASDIWHFAAYVSSSEWPYLRIVEGVYSTDQRKGRMFVENNPVDQQKV